MDEPLLVEPTYLIAMKIVSWIVVGIIAFRLTFIEFHDLKQRKHPSDRFLLFDVLRTIVFLAFAQVLTAGLDLYLAVRYEVSTDEAVIALRNAVTFKWFAVSCALLSFLLFRVQYIRGTHAMQQRKHG